jgi:dGTP triphosphohydrolase
MKAKTARTLLMAGTMIGGLMYFSQTAQASRRTSVALSDSQETEALLRTSKAEIVRFANKADEELQEQAIAEAKLLDLKRELQEAIYDRDTTKKAIARGILSTDMVSTEQMYYYGLFTQTFNPSTVDVTTIKRTYPKWSRWETENNKLRNQQSRIDHIILPQLATNANSFINRNQRSASFRYNNPNPAKVI